MTPHDRDRRRRTIAALLAQLAYELKDDESLDPKVRGLLAEIWRSFEHYI